MSEKPSEPANPGESPAPDAAETPPGWQPLTFGGVASFAKVSTFRVFVVQLIAAALVSGCVVWFAHRNYCPVIAQAISRMPEHAGIRNGRLLGVTENLETGSKFLDLAVTPEPAHEFGQGADLQIQLRQRDFCAVSVFRPDWGWEFPYGRGANLSLSPTDLGPWWGAWQPVLLAGGGAAIIVFMITMWVLLALCYFGPAKALASLARRDVAWLSAWKICAIALVPGALLMTMAIVLYGCQAIDLTGLLFFALAHLVVGWIYVVGGILACKRKTVSGGDNPFADNQLSR